MPLILEEIASPQQKQTIERYFQTFNNGDFEATAALFSETGQMKPPFEELIEGTEAISAYLHREAEGMQAYPQEVAGEQADDRSQITVIGQVKALVFKVNTAWIFKINATGQIDFVRIKLLASLQELLPLRPQS
ncbi:nuclear transport factor 2 family protein [Oscillatoria sp. CS-180]|uniref:nuclear transport factor 2 family protein n=1 Tax=Oscillatoria sp. CS-180 TaxID=3021720 RepID=UPI00232B55E7|nr:nuclear transport factor 2 family protein [Oscillatoria sp. CS-180]MDB9526224.1 nuclear transport factor 2 family protein [Oscillatoria sp. CS-180]